VFTSTPSTVTITLWPRSAAASSRARPRRPVARSCSEVWSAEGLPQARIRSRAEPRALMGRVGGRAGR